MKKDEELVKCFGKQNLIKKPKQNDYHGLCKHECRLKRECINASRERREERNKQLAQKQYSESALSHAEENERTGANSGFSIFDSSGVELQSASIISPESIHDQREEGCPDFILSGFHISSDTRPVIMEFIHRFAHLYFEAPKLLDSALRNLIRGENQADQARMRGVTREAVSRGVLASMAGVLRPADHVPKDLTTTEKLVYQLCFADRYSERKAAKILKTNHARIHRMKQLIASKIGKNEAGKKRNIKKNEKFFFGGKAGETRGRGGGDREIAR